MNLDSISFHIKDIFDILLVAFFIYQAYRFLNHTRAMPVLVGLLILIIFFILATFLKLDSIVWIFSNISNYLVITLIVLLAPELRRAFSNIGQAGWYRKFFDDSLLPVDEIHQAIIDLASEKTGSLIVLSNQMSLKQLVDSGIQLNANISRELLNSIFYEKNPLHDGAVLIESNRITSAATYLPLSNSNILKKTHGGRHRAGLGISEETDCISIITSEEKGRVSVAFLGNLQENIDFNTVKSLLVSVANNRLNAEWDILFFSKSKGRKK